MDTLRRSAEATKPISPFSDFTRRRVLAELTAASRVWHRLGGRYLLLWCVDRWMRKVIPLRILVVVTHTLDAPPVCSPHVEGLAGGFLEPQQIRDCARDWDGWYSPGFASEALSKGDRCFGLFEGGRLVCYCWYSRGPTPAAFGEILVSVDSRYMYGYNAYTDVEYRGRGLHRHGAELAKRALAAEGEIRGIVAYIEASNVPSLLSAQKMEDAVVGYVFLCRIAGAYRSFATPGCARVGFRTQL